MRVEDVEEPTMREIRYMDKLIDERGRGKAMAGIPRTAEQAARHLAARAP